MQGFYGFQEFLWGLGGGLGYFRVWNGFSGSYGICRFKVQRVSESVF